MAGFVKDVVFAFGVDILDVVFVLDQSADCAEEMLAVIGHGLQHRPNRLTVLVGASQPLVKLPHL